MGSFQRQEEVLISLQNRQFLVSHSGEGRLASTSITASPPPFFNSQLDVTKR